MDTEKELQRDLKNIGPEMARKLLAAGIDSKEKLQDMGAEEAFLAIYESGGFCGKFHPAYLYALEGAISDIDWIKISEKRKEEFKLFCRSLKKDNA